MGMLADAPFAATVAAPGHVALEASHAIEPHSPQPGSKTDAASAIQPVHATIRNMTIINYHSFFATWRRAQRPIRTHCYDCIPELRACHSTQNVTSGAC
jgi:hypothetical protein